VGVDGSGGDAVSLPRDGHVSVPGGVDTLPGVDRVVVYRLGRPRGEIAVQRPENTPGRFVVRQVWRFHVVCAFQCSDVRLPKPGFALDGLVSADHV